MLTRLPYGLILLVLAQLGVFLWTVLRWRGIRPVLVTNLLLAAAMLFFVAPLLPPEVRYILSGAATDWFDFKATIWSFFESAVLTTALLALFGIAMPTIVTWVAFAVNFAITVHGVWFFMNFHFKCCGYL